MKLQQKRSLYLAVLGLVFFFLIVVLAMAGITTSNAFYDWFDTAKANIETNLVIYCVVVAIYTVLGYIVVFKKK